MITENISTLKIHRLTEQQFNREKEAGNLDTNAIYLTPDEEVSIDQTYNPKSENAQSGKAVAEALSSVQTNGEGIIVIEQVFNPESLNAQSGRAVKDALSKTENTLLSTIDPVDAILNSRILSGTGGFVGDEDKSKGCVVYILPVKDGDVIQIEGVYANGVRAAYAYTYYTNSTTFVAHSEIPTSTNSQPQTLNITVNGYSYIGVETMTNVSGFDFKVTVTNRYNTADEYFLNQVARRLRTNKDVGNEIAIPTFITNDDVFESGYISAGTGAFVSHTNYLTSSYLPVTELSTILLDFVYTPGMSIAHFYDENKEYLTSIKHSAGGAQLRNCVIQVPPYAKFMRYATTPLIIERDLMVVKYVDYVPENSVSSALVKGWYEQTDRTIVKLFKTAATPMITFIDDDTVSLEHVQRYYEICNNAGIKGCYSVLTSEFDTTEGLVDKLLEYEQEGFQSILHCNTQGSEFQNVNAQGVRPAESIAACERNVVMGLQKMFKAGFTNYKYWCTPYGYSDPALKNIAKKWGLNCLISSGNMDYNAPTSKYNRWHVSRFTFNNPADDTNDESFNRIKAAIDEASQNGGWVLVTTHTYEVGWGTDEGKQRFKDLVDYAKSKSVEPKTIGEAFTIREPIYKFYETF